jgi:mutator family transposase
VGFSLSDDRAELARELGAGDPVFQFQEEIRRVIYTTYAIESLNFSLRKIIKNRSLFPNDEAVFKLLYLALKNIEKKWTMPISEADIEQFEWIEESKTCREWLIPAHVINANSAIEMLDEEAEDAILDEIWAQVPDDLIMEIRAEAEETARRFEEKGAK